MRERHDHARPSGLVSRDYPATGASVPEATATSWTSLPDPGSGRRVAAIRSLAASPCPSMQLVCVDLEQHRHPVAQPVRDLTVS